MSTYVVTEFNVQPERTEELVTALSRALPRAWPRRVRGHLASP